MTRFHARVVVALTAALFGGLSVSAGIAAAPGSETPPVLRLPAGVAPVRYALDWTLDPARDSFDGVVDIDLSVARPTSIVWLNAVDIDVHEAVLTAGTRKSEARLVPGGEQFRGFAFDPPVPAGAARLRIAYTAKVQQTDTNGVFHQKVGSDWYAYTQFESIFARKAVPCFDEPSFKVPWRVTLRVPRGQTAVSNSPIESERDEDARHVVVFRETKPLPSYLVAVGLGPFDVVDAGRVGQNAVPVRILVTRGRARETRYAVEIQKAMMERLEAYFGTAYPYEKLDHLVIPQTVGFGAMENAGLITWTEHFILARPEEETADFQRSYSVVALHEIAHQWFGDYVTLAWWDDTWLNESFATWISEKLLREWKPEWKRDVTLALDRSDTLDRDTLKTTRRIRQPILSNGDIDNAFDDMSYGKGGAVLAMFERWVGPDRFQSGVRAYLAAHSWKTATSADFLSALETAGGADVAGAFSTFLEQPGFPLVTAALRCAPGAPPRLALRQSRLLAQGSPSDAALWRVPICARWGGTSGKSGEGRACTLLSTAQGDLELRGATGCPDWVLANEGEVGYYRVAYEGGLQSRLLENGAPELTAAERVGVLADVKALAELGRIPIEQALSFVPEFATDSTRLVVSTLVEIAGSVDDHLVSDSLRPNYERFLRGAFGNRARELSWTPARGEPDDAQQLRPTLLESVAGRGRDPDLRREGAALGRRWLDDRSAVSPSVASLALLLAAQEGDAALFDKMSAALKNTRERRDRRRIFVALGSFLDPALEARALALILDPAYDARESMTTFWRAMADRRTRPAAWSFFRTNFDAIVAKMPRESLPFLPRAGERFCDGRSREEVRAFFEPRIQKIEGAQRPLAQTLEEIDRCSRLAGDQQEGVRRFLQKFGSSSQSASR